MLLTSAIRAASSDGHFDTFLMAVAASGFSFAFAAVAWLWPGALARLAVRNSALEVFESPIDAKEIQYIAISLLGVAFAFDGIVRLLHELFIAIGVGSIASMSFTQALKHELQDVLTSTSRVVLGGVLVLGARGLVGWLRSMREHGLPPALPEAPPEGANPGRE
jgi:hypothetical protein